MTDRNYTQSKNVKCLSGQKFGRLSIISFAYSENNKAKWICICECGTSIICEGWNMRSGHTKSCGCLSRETSIRNKTTHNLSGTVEYNTWQAIKSRCLNPNVTEFKNYGGRGITVCDRWLQSFENFYADMGDRPEGMTIERKNNNVGYSAENCKWATMKEQQRNRRDTRYIPHNEEIHCLAEWAEIVGIKYSTLWERLGRGWSINKTFTTPIIRGIKL